jgi:hypothetical protein
MTPGPAARHAGITYGIDSYRYFKLASRVAALLSSENRRRFSSVGKTHHS